VVRDRQLPLLAKTIYAYFCSYAGNGYQAYPKRDKTVRDLNINKDTYTKHLAFLVAGGYIGKVRTAAGNLYTIMRTVPGYDSPTQSKDDMNDALVMEGVGAQGFGTVPKIVMLDAGLTAQAKAIYAYFASFAGAGTTAFPRRATIMRDLGLSQATYYTHFNLLTSLGYVSVEQRKSNGKYMVSLYRLSERVDAPAPPQPSSPSREGNRKAMSENAMSEKLAHGETLKTSPAMSEKPMSEKPLSEKSGHGNSGRPNIRTPPVTEIKDFERGPGTL
jgi:hypothetical protein